MRRATVHLEVMTSFTVEVEVPDDTDEDNRDDVAIEIALRRAPSLCMQCSGWNAGWSRDEAEWQPIDDGAVVWSTVS